MNKRQEHKELESKGDKTTLQDEDASGKECLHKHGSEARGGGGGTTKGKVQ